MLRMPCTDGHTRVFVLPKVAAAYMVMTCTVMTYIVMTTRMFVCIGHHYIGHS